jgi:hypothetical protein
MCSCARCAASPEDPVDVVLELGFDRFQGALSLEIVVAETAPVKGAARLDRRNSRLLMEGLSRSGLARIRGWNRTPAASALVDRL